MTARTPWTQEEKDLYEQLLREEIEQRGTFGAVRRAATRHPRSTLSAERYCAKHKIFERLKTEVQPLPRPVTYPLMEDGCDFGQGEGASPPESRAGTKGPASLPEPLDPVHPELRALERKLQGSRDEVAQLRAKLRKEEREGGVIEELTAVMESVLEPSAPPLRIAPASMDPHIMQSSTDVEENGRRDDRFPVDAVIGLTDQHADRVVREEGVWGLERYDFNIFRSRLWEYAKNVERYTQQHLPRFRFETLWVWHLGDSVNGDIHNMKQRNQFANSMKAALAVGEVQAQAISHLSRFFSRVVIVCVPGNHGRTTTKIEHSDPHDSFDYITAMAMKMRLTKHENVQVFTPRSWAAHVEVRGHLWHLEHGHGVKGVWGIPWYGFERKEGRVQRLLSMIDRQADFFAYGHFHTPMQRQAGRGKAIHFGAWYLTDDYAINTLSVGNEPEQQLLVTSERFGRQMEIPIMLRDHERERALLAGEYDPPLNANMTLDGDELPQVIGAVQPLIIR